MNGLLFSLDYLDLKLARIAISFADVVLRTLTVLTESTAGAVSVRSTGAVTAITIRSAA